MSASPITVHVSQQVSQQEHANMMTKSTPRLMYLPKQEQALNWEAATNLGKNFEGTLMER